MQVIFAMVRCAAHMQAGQANDNDNSASQADGGQDDEQVAESEEA